MDKNKLKLLVFDADDTLWDCQSYFDGVEEQYCDIMRAYAPKEEVKKRLFATEMKNMPELGYGGKAFVISLVENTIGMTGGRASAQLISQVMDMGRSLLHLPATPLPGVEDALMKIHSNGSYRMVVLTKGELRDQTNKMRRSGLMEYFDDVVIVDDKTEEEYVKLCHAQGVEPQQMLMIGNSFKSDALPALRVGAYAVYIPFKITWQHEVAEVIEHPCLITLNHISQLIPLLL